MNAHLTSDPRGRNAAAWAFVMENYAEMERYAGQMASKTPSLDAGDLLNESILAVLDRFETFDPARGTSGAFCYWQVRRSATSLLRSAGVGRAILCAQDPANPSILSFAESETSTPETLEAHVEVSTVRRSITDSEWDAVVSKAAGDTSNDVEATLGITMQARNQRLYRMRRRIGLEAR